MITKGGIQLDPPENSIVVVGVVNEDAASQL